MEWIRTHSVPLFAIAIVLLLIIAVWRATSGQWLGVALPIVLAALAAQQIVAIRKRDRTR